MARLSVAQMRAHILQLSTGRNIRIEWRRDRDGAWAARSLNLISIPRIRSAINYAVALHEIGHLLGPGQRASRMRCERGAWRWAKTNAIAWLASMNKTERRSLAWCECNARRAKAVGKKPAGKGRGDRAQSARTH